ncbi:hypothetical protein DFH07DRAFT_1029118 [Mycena maculata]|uniref:Uncharacterized protein n=1 Tax=Mycena maculata TaxID=230809 RepID=A0AAD7ND24_9AGAR|nr:hypothetical protein DFH07DRAFT_1029118 [Mycena maculata]
MSERIPNMNEQTCLCTEKHWPVTDRDKLFKFILGQDAEGDKRSEQHKKNPGHIYDVALKNLFKGKHTVDVIRSQWQCTVKLYGRMVVFAKFTGNGGVDPNTDDPSAVLKGKLGGAHTARLAIGSLIPVTILEWDLFDQQAPTHRTLWGWEISAVVFSV